MDQRVQFAEVHDVQCSRSAPARIPISGRRPGTPELLYRVLDQASQLLVFLYK